MDFCLTWYPGSISGDPDISTWETSAGYSVASNREWYCGCGVQPVRDLWIFWTNEVGGCRSVGNEDAGSEIVSLNKSESNYFYEKNGEEFNTSRIGIVLNQKNIESITVHLEVDDAQKGACEKSSLDGKVDLELSSDNNWFSGIWERDEESEIISGANPNVYKCLGNDAMCAYVKACFGTIKEQGKDSPPTCDNSDKNAELTGFIWFWKDSEGEKGGTTRFGYKGGDTNEPDIKITLKNGCAILFNVPRNDKNQMGIVYTNRMNNIKDYAQPSFSASSYRGNGENEIAMNSSGKINDTKVSFCGLLSWDGSNITVGGGGGTGGEETQTIKCTNSTEMTYSTPCIPWGAVSGWDEENKNSWVRIKTVVSKETREEICPSEGNIVNENGVYDLSTLPPFLPKLGPKKYLFDIGSTWKYYELTSSGLSEESVFNKDETANFKANKAPNIGSVKVSDNGKYDIGEVNSFSLSRNIFYGGSGVVDLMFYAWADKDHMPITGILVDWGDGTQSGSTDIIAKNHKPKCCESNDSCSNLKGAKNIGYIYDSDKSVTVACNEQDCLNFGNIPEACESGEQGDKFFTFSHIYTCSTSDKYFDSNKGYCLFSPKVYIKDNWGWCNTGRPEKEDDFCPKASSEVSTKDWPKVIVYPFEE